MKKLFSIIIMVVVIFSFGSCSNKKTIGNNETYFYLGQSDSWLVTYSISNAKSSNYNSLSIQYIFDDSKESDIEKVGPIEYQLNGNSMKIESSYPQELQGIGYFHTGSRMNAENFTVTLDNEINLSIQWQDNNEVITLKRQK